MGIVDCHFHVIAAADRFPMLAGRSYTPAPASLEAWQATLAPLGVTHGVVVQPSVYGIDNRVLLAALKPCEDALRAFGLDDASAELENTALFAHGMGLLLLQHTGRIRLFGQEAEPLFQRYLDQLNQLLDDPLASLTFMTGMHERHLQETLTHAWQMEFLQMVSWSAAHESDLEDVIARVRDYYLRKQVALEHELSQDPAFLANPQERRLAQLRSLSCTAWLKRVNTYLKQLENLK